MKKRYNFFIDEEILARMQRAAPHKGQTVSDLIRDAIELHLEFYPNAGRAVEPTSTPEPVV